MLLYMGLHTGLLARFAGTWNCQLSLTRYRGRLPIILELSVRGDDHNREGRWSHVLRPESAGRSRMSVRCDEYRRRWQFEGIRHARLCLYRDSVGATHVFICFLDVFGQVS